MSGTFKQQEEEDKNEEKEETGGKRNVKEARNVEDRIE